MATLPSLTDADLKELGVKMGARKQIRAALMGSSPAPTIATLPLHSHPTGTPDQDDENALTDVKILRLIAQGGHGAVYEGLWQGKKRKISLLPLYQAQPQSP